MARNLQSSVQDKIADVTECSICTEIFINPKILPCVHTFCLHCLETYGKEKKPGDQMVCPICRNEFIIADGGLSNLPSNFFIGKMVEIGKLAMAPVNEATCNICPEGEEAIAKVYCVDCEQILCDRCSISHKKTKISENHQIVELGSKLKAQTFNLRNSYCGHHPKELIKMYCYNDNEAICLICCAESHESHRRINIEQAAGEFKQRLKEDLGKVTNRLPDYEEVWHELHKYRKEFTRQISKTEDGIRDMGSKLKELIDQHTDLLLQNLKSVMEQNLKAFEITKQNLERFRVMIESFSTYSEELLSRGSPVDICRAADQMHSRANELEKLPANCSGDSFRCKTVAFQPSSFEKLLKQCRSNNAVGEITVTESPNRIIKFEIESTGGIWPLDAIEAKTRDLVPLQGFITVTTTEPDMITLDDDPTQKRAKMPCGHVIGTNSMKEYCQHLLTQGKYKFCCPALNCNREWEYFLVRHVACLSPDEMRKFEKEIASNYLKKAWDQYRKCPGCQVLCFRAPDVRNNCVRCPICTKTKGRAGFTFCWNCLEKWQRYFCSGKCGNPGCDGTDKRITTLVTCPTMRIKLCQECPCIRGCPRCGLLIEHQGKSAHARCFNCLCEFCFICLKEKKGGNWQCSPLGTCKLASRQAS